MKYRDLKSVSDKPWSKREKRKLLDYFKHQEGSGPRAVQRAQEQVKAALEASRFERQELRAKMRLGGGEG